MSDDVTTKFIPLNLDALIDLAAFVSDDKHRTYLHGVHVDPSTGHYVATDGATLGAIEDETAKAAPAKKYASGEASEWGWTLRVDKDFIATVKRIRKAYKPIDLDRLYVPHTARAGDVVTAYIGAKENAPFTPEFSVPMKLVHGIFPEWQRVVPSTVSQASERANVQVKPALLARFALGLDTALFLFAPERDKRKNGGYLDGAERPIIVLNSQRSDFFGAIMPCAFGKRDDPRQPLDYAPGWLQRRLGKVAEQAADIA
ncbi:hypothetical protein [Dongia sp.]|uniref:hypothetical protein n=1 Tax=Dongia sp. TaxID=1977262 RepID=UPI0035AD7C33